MNESPDIISKTTIVIEDTVVIQNDYSKISEAKGDLDGDQIPETAIVLSKDGNEEREIQLFKYRNGNRELWHTSVGAVLPGTFNSIENNPIGNISIEGQLLEIWHATQTSTDGGVNFTHKYRYIDQKWQLVFVESNSSNYSIKDQATHYGECKYDLVTGDLSYKRKTEKFISGKGYEIVNTVDKVFVLKLDKLPLMDDFSPGKHTLKEINEIYY